MLGKPNNAPSIDKRPMYTYYDVADHLMDHGYVPHPSAIGRVKTALDADGTLPDAEALAAMNLPRRTENKQ